jgi:hypothetical protein
LNTLIAEHVMTPDQKADHRDRHAGEGDEGVAEDPFPGKAGDQLADHTHAGQDHNVDGRMRIEPEQVLIEQGVTAQPGVEDANV